MNDAAPLETTLSRWQRLAVVVAASGCVISGLLATSDVEQFLQSYLVGFLFWWSASVGCLGLLMMYHLVGGRWGAAARPFLEAGSLTIPLTALLFLPIALNLDRIYPWTHPGVVSEQKALYLNATFFHGRAAGCFIVWSILALLLRRPASAVEAEPSRQRRMTSAGGLVVLILTVTFAGIDWGMSLDPHWFSSIYGTVILIGGALAGMALVTLTCAAIEWRLRPHAGLFASHTLADLATLMLAFLMLWAYFCFSQFLIIWSGNLPEENVWYVDRLEGGWQWIGLGIVLFQFVVPFFLLLSRDLKQSPRSLTAVAALVFVMHSIEIFWMIIPSFRPRQFVLHGADVVVPAAIGGVWTSAYFWLIQRRAPQIAATDQP